MHIPDGILGPVIADLTRGPLGNSASVPRAASEFAALAVGKITMGIHSSRSTNRVTYTKVRSG